MKAFLFVAMTAAFTYVCVATEKDHEMCSTSCTAKYPALKESETACLIGCRLYGMIFLAHDPSVERAEILGLCTKSCSSGPAPKPCAVGCSEQDRVFRERQVGAFSAKLAVMHGLDQVPVVDSPAPYHSRMFSRLPVPSASAAGHPHAWLRAVSIHVRPLPAGPDGRPRYWVEVSEQIIPLQLTEPHLLRQELLSRETAANENQHLQSRLNFEDRLSPRARAGIRWAACALLIMSIVGLMWLCCSVFPTAPKVRVSGLSIVLGKQPLPSVQSGDILGIRSSEDKKPLMLSEAALGGKAVDAV